MCKMLKGLSPRKATGLDDLPARFILDGAKGIANPISYIINLSLKTGVVPDEMKTARVIPLYKKNSKLEPAFTTGSGPVVRDHQKLCRTTRTFYPVVLWTTKIYSPIDYLPSDQLVSYVFCRFL